MFQALEFYPELKAVRNHFQEIKEEILSLRSKMTYINDIRVNTDVWNIFPLLPEEEDRSIISEEIWKKNQLLAPKSTKLLSSIEALKAYSFSSLSVGGHILPHKHENKFVTAILCIQDGGNSYIIVEDEKKKFKNNQILVFDYTKEHEVYNKGNNDRIVLLMLLENRCLPL